MSDIDLLRALPLWSEAPSIAALSGGRTNANYLVKADGRSLFARIGSDLPHHAIEREVERQALRLAGKVAAAPRIVHAGNGILVTEFIPGRTLAKADIDVPQLRSIADLLRRLHAVPAMGLREFSPVDTSLFYLAQLPDTALPVKRSQIVRCVERLAHPLPICLVHGDPIPENFIKDANRLTLVDWEYAGRGAPEVDLALVIANFDLDENS